MKNFPNLIIISIQLKISVLLYYTSYFFSINEDNHIKVHKVILVTYRRGHIVKETDILSSSPSLGVHLEKITNIKKNINGNFHYRSIERSSYINIYERIWYPLWRARLFVKGESTRKARLKWISILIFYFRCIWNTLCNVVFEVIFCYFLFANNLYW